ncbi:isoflavone reductase family protein [Diaporthe amygdali]|uniref:isoflavone reductase family protein n=1 Tax=Phomopsis amygdali TaxID=1214568 RepID=UPI0022FDD785|nr:isoflavone reductase family protein [Diaporthe amygdali]KAJ0115084.1 isoflavone reductase family protein [Diaporthe amygdali]
MGRTIQKVALTGATGNVGAPILKNLLRNNFQVTVLTRSADHAFPNGVNVHVVDYSSSASLESALRGCDACVDANLTQDDTPIRLMNAAAAVGVYRYIPSDYSLDPFNPKLNALPVFAMKDARDRHLFKVCEQSSGSMTWSIVCNGPFLDWNLRTGFKGIDLYNKKATIMGTGTNKHPWTMLDDVGKAVAGILLKPVETENRPVFVYSVVKSDEEMLKLAQEALGSDAWVVKTVDPQATFDKAVADLKAGIINMQVFGDMIRFSNTQPDMAHPWHSPDNELLGVQEMSDDEVQVIIKSIVEKKLFKRAGEL